MTQYIRSFIIGSSIPVVLPYFLSVQRLKYKNYSYENYTLVAPMYFGTMNMISLYLQKRYNLTNQQRYSFIGILSPCLVVSVAMLSNSYNFTTTEWIQYAIRIFLFHFMTWVVVINALGQLV